jgi:hypothetical protein
LGKGVGGERGARVCCSAIVGFVNATRTKSLRLDEESMADHDPEGETVAIHSVVVSRARRISGSCSWHRSVCGMWCCRRAGAS